MDCVFLMNALCCCCELFSVTSGEFERDARYQDLVVGVSWLQFFCGELVAIYSHIVVLCRDTASWKPGFFDRMCPLPCSHTYILQLQIMLGPAMGAKSQEFVSVLRTHTNRVSQNRVYVTHASDIF